MVKHCLDCGTEFCEISRKLGLDGTLLSPWPPRHDRTSVWSFGDNIRNQFFLGTNHYSPEKKILKLSDPVRKWPHLDLEHILIHRPHFLTISDERGLNPRLREHNNSFATILTRVWCQKTVSIEWFDTEDRARELISEVTGGLYERKSVQKRL